MRAQWRPVTLADEAVFIRGQIIRYCGIIHVRIKRGDRVFVCEDHVSS